MNRSAGTRPADLPRAALQRTIVGCTEPAASKGEHVPTDHPFADRWNHNTAQYPRIAELIAQCLTVLDVGCGEGTLSHYIAGQGHEVVGVDVDPQILPADQDRAHFVLGDATGLSFMDDSFDAVVSVAALHQTRMDLALVEMRRVVRSGGLLVNIGLGLDKGISDRFRSIADEVADLPSRIRNHAWEPDTIKMNPLLTWTETRQAIEEILPGASWQRLRGHRYLSVWRRP